jgi:hypothetical protein
MIEAATAPPTHCSDISASAGGQPRAETCEPVSGRGLDLLGLGRWPRFRLAEHPPTVFAGAPLVSENAVDPASIVDDDQFALNVAREPRAHTASISGLADS